MYVYVTSAALLPIEFIEMHHALKCILWRLILQDAFIVKYGSKYNHVSTTDCFVHTVLSNTQDDRGWYFIDQFYRKHPQGKRASRSLQTHRLLSWNRLLELMDDLREYIR